MDLSEANRLRLLKDHIETYGLIRHQIDSFNYFINFGIKTIVDDEASVAFTLPNRDKVQLKFENVHVSNPIVIDKNRNIRLLYPSEARESLLNYEAIVYTDVVEYNNGALVKKQHKIPIAKIPIMLRCDKCNLYNLTNETALQKGEIDDDKGGYFIINGNERVIIGQMKNAYNLPLCSKNKDTLICELRSMSEETGHSVYISLKLNKDKTIEFSTTKFKQSLNISIVYKVLGEPFNIKGEIYQPYISINDVDSEDLCDDYKYFILNDMLPHQGMNCTPKVKALFITKLVEKLILTDLGILKEEDKDNYTNKRMETTGILCFELFKLLYKRFIKTCNLQLEKRPRVDYTDIIVKNNTITTGMLFSFSTGNWGVQKNNYIRYGVSLNMYPKPNFNAMLSYLRRCNIPVGKEGKNIKVRQIHTSSIFFVCPSETPEGQTVGIVLNLALLATISNKHCVVLIKEILDTLKEDKGYNIVINGTIQDTCFNFERFNSTINRMKVEGLLPYDISCVVSHPLKLIYVHCDAGRFLRPLINLNLNRLSFLDVYEVEETTIAIDTESLNKYPKGTFNYMEIHPSCMLGIMAAQIPYANHTQSPRICYQASMAKQAIGCLTSFNIRNDGTMYIQPYVQKPIVTTAIANIIKANDYPTGLNAIVAIACHTGFNQEDSIILNKASIERGMFNCITFKVIVVELKVNDVVKLPLKKMFKTNYNKLDNDGIIKVKSEVHVNDVLLCKVSVDRDSKEEFDHSIVAKVNDEGVVERIIKTYKSGMAVYKFVISQQRIPETGDKFCSGMAQKGTCGIILSQQDMPFTKDGITPDLIINPHCIPSRMTINQIMACVKGKSCCLKGTYGDATPFKGDNLRNICEELKMEGYNFNGTETMYSGTTGVKLKCDIFIGPTYYHRLSHIVSDKIYARSVGGPINALTRQPVNGRANNGGLRIGEMEKDCMLGHGIVKFQNEKMFEQSDKFILKQCGDCHLYTKVVYKNGKLFCNFCRSNNISNFNLPYAAKLVCQELNATLIKTQIK